MIRRYIKAALSRPKTARDALGDFVETLEALRTIDIAITLANGSTSTINDVRAAQASHVGITPDSGVQIGDRLGVGSAVYRVDFTHDLRRYSRLYLKREDEVNG